MAAPRERQPLPSASGDEHDALPVGMPAWAPRAGAWILVLALAAGLAMGFLVPFVRTADGLFVLVPEGTPLPVLAPAGGSLEEVLADEGAEVQAEQVLFRIRVPPASDDGSAESVLREVRSPVAGVLFSRGASEVGAPVEAGRLLARVVPVGSPLAAAIELPEDSLPLVEPGQRARLLLAAYPHQRYGAVDAVIRRVDPIPVASGGVYAVKAYAGIQDATIEVDGEPRPLLPGLRGEARIVVDRRPLLGSWLAGDRTE